MEPAFTLCNPLHYIVDIVCYAVYVVDSLRSVVDSLRSVVDSLRYIIDSSRYVVDASHLRFIDPHLRFVRPYAGLDLLRMFLSRDFTRNQIIGDAQVFLDGLFEVQTLVQGA
jgi:hypothetical protein